MDTDRNELNETMENALIRAKKEQPWLVVKVIHERWGEQLLELISDDIPELEEVVQNEDSKEAVPAWLNEASDVIDELLADLEPADVDEIMAAVSLAKLNLHRALVAAALSKIDDQRHQARPHLVVVDGKKRR